MHRGGGEEEAHANDADCNGHWRVSSTGGGDGTAVQGRMGVAVAFGGGWVVGFGGESAEELEAVGVGGVVVVFVDAFQTIFLLMKHLFLLLRPFGNEIKSDNL
mmetsp:Transcript_1214/g.2753  ORF Transcript_1214/g.2753 Transcript_1214/m.2753 type:complete len:103 (+) Transcript_1214:1008-1316(+)